MKKQKPLTEDQKRHLMALTHMYTVEWQRVGSKELLSPSDLSWQMMALVSDARKMGITFRDINEATRSPRTEAFWHRVMKRWKDESNVIHFKEDLEEIEFNGKTVRGSIDMLKKLVG